MRWAILGLAVLLVGGAMLTIVPAWNVTAWKAAILAGEFGHYAAVAAVVLGCGVLAHDVVMGDERHRWPMTLIPVGLLLAAAGLLFSPTVYAGLLARHLPERMDRAFGAVRFPSRVIHYDELFLGDGETARRAVSTHEFAGEGGVDSLALDFYEARSGGEPAPCVVVVHGGGWDGGDRRQMEDFNHWLAARGFAVAAVSYRLAPTYRWPAQREDVLAAIAWLKAHAGSLRIDPERFVLLGRSAGAQIATAVGYGVDDPAIRGVIGLYGVYDMHFVWSIAAEDDVLNSVKLMRQFLGGGPTIDNQPDYDSASAQLLVRDAARTPPTLLMHGTVDSLCWVQHSRRLAERLEAARVPHVFVELPWATHAFDYNPHGPGGQLTRYAIERFLAAVVPPREAIRH